MVVLEDQAQSPFIHCLSLDGHLEMLREANFYFFFLVGSGCYMIGSNAVTLTLQAHTLII